MDNKGSLLIQNKIFAIFIDLSLLSAAFLSQGFINFAGVPARTFAEYVYLWYPVVIILLLEIIWLKTKKKTLGAEHVAKMKLSWLKTLVLIPVNFIVIAYVGGFVITIITNFLMILLALLGRSLGIIT